VISSIKPATWVALAALALSLTGAARAMVNQITGSQVVNHSITGADIRDRSLVSNDFAAGAVRHVNLDANSVHADDFADAAVNTDKLADRAVTAEKVSSVQPRNLADASVTSGAIAPGAVTADRLAPQTVGGNALALAPITYIGDPGAPPFLSNARSPSHGVLVHPQPDEARAGFYRDASGNVHLVGSFIGFTGDVDFILPPGFRPPADLIFGARAVNGTDILEITSDGAVLALTQAQVDQIDPTTVVPEIPHFDIEDQFLLQGINWRPSQQGIASARG
jgi:hypothetical protein